MLGSILALSLICSALGGLYHDHVHDIHHAAGLSPFSYGVVLPATAYRSAGYASTVAQEPAPGLTSYVSAPAANVPVPSPAATKVGVYETAAATTNGVHNGAPALSTGPAVSGVVTTYPVAPSLTPLYQPPSVLAITPAVTSVTTHRTSPTVASLGYQYAPVIGALPGVTSYFPAFGRPAVAYQATPSSITLNGDASYYTATPAIAGITATHLSAPSLTRVLQSAPTSTKLSQSTPILTYSPASYATTTASQVAAKYESGPVVSTIYESTPIIPGFTSAQPGHVVKRIYQPAQTIGASAVPKIPATYQASPVVTRAYQAYPELYKSAVTYRTATPAKNIYKYYPASTYPASSVSRYTSTSYRADPSGSSAYQSSPVVYRDSQPYRSRPRVAKVYRYGPGVGAVPRGAAYAAGSFVPRRGAGTYRNGPSAITRVYQSAPVVRRVGVAYNAASGETNIYSPSQGFGAVSAYNGGSAAYTSNRAANRGYQPAAAVATGPIVRRVTAAYRGNPSRARVYKPNSVSDGRLYYNSASRPYVDTTSYGAPTISGIYQSAPASTRAAIGSQGSQRVPVAPKGHTVYRIAPGEITRFASARSVTVPNEYQSTSVLSGNPAVGNNAFGSTISRGATYQGASGVTEITTSPVIAAFPAVRSAAKVHTYRVAQDVPATPVISNTNAFNAASSGSLVNALTAEPPVRAVSVSPATSKTVSYHAPHVLTAIEVSPAIPSDGSVTSLSNAELSHTVETVAATPTAPKIPSSVIAPGISQIDTQHSVLPLTRVDVSPPITTIDTYHVTPAVASVAASPTSITNDGHTTITKVENYHTEPIATHTVVSHGPPDAAVVVPSPSIPAVAPELHIPGVHASDVTQTLTKVGSYQHSPSVTVSDAPTFVAPIHHGSITFVSPATYSLGPLGYTVFPLGLGDADGLSRYGLNYAYGLGPIDYEALRRRKK